NAVPPAHVAKGRKSSPAQPPATPANAKDILTESGLESAETRAYSNGNAAVTLTIYRLHDSSGAYEAYTFFQDPKNSCPQFSALIPCSTTPVDASSDKKRVALVGNI